jgi:rRNA-processing protein FCF1
MIERSVGVNAGNLKFTNTFNIRTSGNNKLISTSNRYSPDKSHGVHANCYPNDKTHAETTQIFSVLNVNDSINQDYVVHGSRVHIKNVDGYIVLDKDGKVTLSETIAYTFTILLRSPLTIKYTNHVGLLGSNQCYVSFANDGLLYCNYSSTSEYTWFKLENAEGHSTGQLKYGHRVLLKTFKKRYISSPNAQNIHALTESAVPDAIFTLLNPSNNAYHGPIKHNSQVLIKAFHDHYLTVSGTQITAQSTLFTPNNVFTILMKDVPFEQYISPKKVYVLLDTNVFHYNFENGKLENLFRTKNIILLIPYAVYQELDHQKTLPKLQQTAKQCLYFLTHELEKKEGHVRVQQLNEYMDLSHLTHKTNDDDIVACGVLFNKELPVVLITADSGLRGRALGHSLAAVKNIDEFWSQHCFKLD